LELSRQRLRNQVLRQFRYIRTCVLARELCLLVRSNRAALDPKDVHEFCNFIANLCEEAGCKEQCELCRKAAEAVLNDEEQYLQICKQSCLKCGESRRITTRKSTYVA
jgi:hypothetical protein